MSSSMAPFIINRVSART